MSGSMEDEQPTEYRNRKKKKPRRIDGKRVVKRKGKEQQMPRRQVVCSDNVVAVVEGYGVTEADLASVRAMVLGIPLASMGGM
ncbi:hypothetical protein [Nonomuraea cavernae]|uniref:Uncharacterized protein n=1 Tax=Nonomuraea cavernae TaxID=2045107 RepID=A0A918DG48_9ACTN|nr:hypothetical protein [Nonomuraea cavernae]MCA2184678.1 hypothetical protein [Nonomuraea cavernae]GGO63087.1 hypothetical protein GCM10012289_09190 [Nonomuraea cavernae]